MVRELLRRPSVIVSAWTLVVVSVFVAHGDLRIARPEDRNAAPPLVARSNEPVVVRRPTTERTKAVPTVARRGRVFDALGFLVVGAEIVPMERPPSRSDGDGAFTLEFAPSSYADVLVRADDRQPVWLRASEGSPDALAVQLTPRAPWDRPPQPPQPPSTLRGEGTVRTADGAPMPRAFVTSVGSAVWARADDIGRYVLPIASPSCVLLAHDPEAGVGRTGFFGRGEPFVSERTNGAVPLPDLVVGPALALRGIVRDSRGEPVVGVPVEVNGDPMRRLVETGAGGAFHVGGLAPGRYDVRPFPFRGAVGATQSVTLAGAPVDVDLHLVAANEVRLRVVDERGAPVAGVFVASSMDGTRRGIAVADAEGRASVPVADHTEFEVRTAEHYAPVTVRRFDAEPATLVVTLP